MKFAGNLPPGEAVLFLALVTAFGAIYVALLRRWVEPHVERYERAYRDRMSSSLPVTSREVFARYKTRPWLYLIELPKLASLHNRMLYTRQADTELEALRRAAVHRYFVIGGLSGVVVFGAVVALFELLR